MTHGSQTSGGHGNCSWVLAQIGQADFLCSTGELDLNSHMTAKHSVASILKQRLTIYRLVSSRQTDSVNIQEDNRTPVPRALTIMVAGYSTQLDFPAPEFRSSDSKSWPAGGQRPEIIGLAVSRYTI
ncbi:hypothetical protein PoB_004767600 [Plakobranchus ocellatus]|uniref:Uncharacterized protein n=1 Tax=Plakobranchus ocellatus TaxID=259542 RepID=A0AAV4BL82_9GAST|nr:hypothetical protein PoB_004767600 [Plakobranchus ocellatus]